MGLGPWHGAAIRAEVMAEAAKRLEAAAIDVQNHAKRLLSTSGTARVRGAGGRFGRRYGANPSAPGQPPHKQTGRLRMSVTREMVGQTVARVGTNLKYGLYLEMGTRKMAARPWLRRALEERKARIRAIFGG
jgi:HK97 gp10 family phage protein